MVNARSSRGGLAFAAVAALCALALIAAGERSPAGARGSTYVLESIGNFNSPVHVDDAPGAAGLLFVVERAGRIRVLEDGVKKSDPFLDIKDIVQAGGEEGLLSVAFHPDYATNRRFFVYYTNNNGDIRVDRFRRKQGTPLEASPNSRRKVIRIDHDQAGNHNGGQLQFGPDGSLYLGVGDGGPQGDPENDAQEPASLLGKLLRIDPVANGGYDIPADNPYAEPGDLGADEIYAIGLRNPWRFSFDSATGALTIGDVGGSDWEEIDYVGGVNPGLGANFGWNDFEGTNETAFGTGPNASPHTPPVAEFSHDSPNDFCSITGGYVVRDPGLPALDGEYLFADLCKGELRTVDVPSGADATDLGLDVGSPSSFGEGKKRQIYVVSLDGDVFALEQSP